MIFTKWVLSTAAITILTTSAALISHTALADTKLPFSEVIEAIYEGNGGNIPILVPKSLPTDEQLYWSVDSQANRYSVSFSFASNCQNIACSWGSFSAERGADFSSSDGDYTEGVALAKGKKGRFRLFKGMYNNAFVEWKQGGILYTAQIKNGHKEDVVKMANSAINSRQ